VDCHNVFWAEGAKRAVMRNGVPCDPTARYWVCNRSFGGSNYADTLSQLPRLLQQSWDQMPDHVIQGLLGIFGIWRKMLPALSL
jgi:hypothetical protein